MFRHKEKNLTKLKISSYVDSKKNLIFEQIKFIESGVHVCAAILPYSKLLVPVEIYALAVKTKYYSMDAFGGTQISLPCNNFVITQVIGNLSVIWFKDDKIFKKIKYTYSFSGASLFFEDLTAFDSGIYECKVIDTLRNRTWITNRINLYVRSINNFLLNFTFWIITACLAVFSFVLYIFVVVYRFKVYKKTEEKFFAVDKTDNLQLEMMKPVDK